jgi:hypothetical protein
MAKKILLTVVVVLVVVVGGFLGIVAMQPSKYHIERSAAMAAPPEEVFEHINNLRKWNDWSPWAKLDPHAKNTFEGPESGEGAIFRWAGNDQVGEGSLTIVESKPSEHVKLKLDFIKPMQDTATTDFRFQPSGEKTVVTWTMDGENGFVEKMFCMFMDMEGMVGGSYEEGLANIKKIVEAPPAGSEASATDTPAPEVTPNP